MNGVVPAYPAMRIIVPDLWGLLTDLQSLLDCQ
jgi:hypothetical protein